MLDAAVPMRLPRGARGLAADSMRFLRFLECGRRAECAPDVACPMRIGPRGIAFDIVLRRIDAEGVGPAPPACR